MSLPVLWSFRRCPYAMRARLAVASAGIPCDLREVVLRDKPGAFLDTSPSGTVPCLNTGTTVIDESRDIMHWALAQSDPEGWLDMPTLGHSLIDVCDGAFKTALDHYKYPTRYAGIDPVAERGSAGVFLHELNAQLGTTPYLFGPTPKLADMAILPFIRQVAHVDLDWFTQQDWTAVTAWLDRFKTSQTFAQIMHKIPQWTPDSPPLPFPGPVPVAG
ncbi:MAG: glutathione S-transferase [Roseovarius sp.]